MATIKSLISEDGKIKYSPEGIASWKPIIESCKGKEVYMTMIPASEIDYTKDLTKYYMEWILPFITVPLKTKGIATLREAHYYLLQKFSPSKKIDDLDKQFSIPLPIEDMELSQRVKFISDVAIWGEKSFGITFPSAKDA